MMKYKNINSAIHNFGHSFTSFENYVDDDYVVYELRKIHLNGHDISIDWRSGRFSPSQCLSQRIKRSVEYWATSLDAHLLSQNISPESIKVIRFEWPADSPYFMVAIDDRGVVHKQYFR